MSEIHSLGRSGNRELTVQVVRPAPAAAERTGTESGHAAGAVGQDCVVLYFHGGSFTEGSAAYAADQCGCLARTLNMPVVVLDYALAPTHPFPAAIEDGLRALDWLGSEAPRTSGLRVREVVLAGTEAGGNIAASVALLAQDRPCMRRSSRRPALRAQILISPLLDPCMTMAAQSSECTRGWRAYLPRLADRTHPYASPLNSSRLTGMPPALILTGSQDPQRAEAERYSAKLIAAGVPVQAMRLASVMIPGPGPGAGAGAGAGAGNDSTTGGDALAPCAARFDPSALTALANFLTSPALNRS